MRNKSFFLYLFIAVVVFFQLKITFSAVLLFFFLAEQLIAHTHTLVVQLFTLSIVLSGGIETLK